jgi:hypothetical protein
MKGGKFMVESFDKLFEGTGFQYRGIDYNHTDTGEFYSFKFRIGVEVGTADEMREKIIKEFQKVGLTFGGGE